MSDIDAARFQSLRDGYFQAIDWGSSNGGSIDHIRQRYGYDRVVGVEMDPAKVAVARSAGREVIQADATALDAGRGIAEASFMFHFLEHLPSVDHAARVIAQACLAARYGVYIRQPMFGADEALLRLGLRFSWSSWTGHPNRMTTLDFFRILKALQEGGAIHSFGIGYGYPVHTTGVDFILPIDADDEAIVYDPASQGPKPDVVLSGVYKEVCVAIGVDPAFDIDKAAALLKCDHWVARRPRPA